MGPLCNFKVFSIYRSKIYLFFKLKEKTHNPNIRVIEDIQLKEYRFCSQLTLFPAAGRAGILWQPVQNASVPFVEVGFFERLSFLLDSRGRGGCRSRRRRNRRSPLLLARRRVLQDLLFLGWRLSSGVGRLVPCLGGQGSGCLLLLVGCFFFLPGSLSLSLFLLSLKFPLLFLVNFLLFDLKSGVILDTQRCSLPTPNTPKFLGWNLR